MAAAAADGWSIATTNAMNGHHSRVAQRNRNDPLTGLRRRAHVVDYPHRSTQHSPETLDRSGQQCRWPPAAHTRCGRRRAGGCGCLLGSAVTAPDSRSSTRAPRRVAAGDTAADLRCRRWWCSGGFQRSGAFHRIGSAGSPHRCRATDAATAQQPDAPAHRRWAPLPGVAAEGRTAHHHDTSHGHASSFSISPSSTVSRHAASIAPSRSPSSGGAPSPRSSRYASLRRSLRRRAGPSPSRTGSMRS
jgi:hypothetical protein